MNKMYAHLMTYPVLKQMILLLVVGIANKYHVNQDNVCRHSVWKFVTYISAIFQQQQLKHLIVKDQFLINHVDVVLLPLLIVVFKHLK